MKSKLNSLGVRCLMFGSLLFAYFVAYPDDFKAVLAPIEHLLTLSNSISPWLYGLAGVGIVSGTIVRVWGKPQ